MSCGSCSGACCTVFTYTTPPEILRTRQPQGQDDAFLADMLVELTPEEAEKRCLALGEATYSKFVPELRYYTCRHYIEDTGDCSAYPIRPRMCREYPYDGACDHGCNYTAPPEVQQEWREIRIQAEQRKAEQSKPSPLKDRNG